MTLIDVVLPTVTGREDTYARCVDSYRKNTATGALRIITIKDEETCGRAWIKGMEKSTAPYIALSCDDLEVISPIWAAVCIEQVDAGNLPCPIVRKPDGSIESCGGDMNASACLISHLQEDGAEADFSPVPFGSKEQVERIGMTEGQYLTDTYFSHMGRRLGWPTRITYGYVFIHHHSNVKRRPVTAEDHRLYAEAMA